MHSEIIFRSSDNSDPIPTVELYRELADALETPCSLDMHDEGGQLVLSEAGIALSLIFDEADNPVTVVAEISPDAETQHVAKLCQVFQKLGWDF